MLFRSVQPASRDEKIKSAVREAFAQTDKEILGLSERKRFDQQGTTALVTLLHGNPKLGTALRLVLAHVGDSRAVLCRAGQAVPVTDDHKPDRLDEKKRIERAGGLVLNVRGAWRVAAPANPRGGTKASRREYQGLAMTRSLGDLCFKQPTALSTPDPEVKVNDSVRLDINTSKILDYMKFDIGNVVMISGGNNIGRVGVIAHLEKHPGSFEIVHVKDALGHTFATRLHNVFVIGNGTKPWISLPKGNGIKLSIVEDRLAKLAKKR